MDMGVWLGQSVGLDMWLGIIPNMGYGMGLEMEKSMGLWMGMRMGLG